MSEATGYLNIPVNVKQYFLPFVLDPNNAINNTLIQSKQEGNAYTQVFSFKPATLRNNRMTPYEAAAGFLRIAPSSFYRSFKVDNDVSYKTLYKYQLGSQFNTAQLTMDELLDNTPSIMIREYLQNSKLNMVVDFLKNSFQALSNGISQGADFAKKLKTYENKFEALKYAFSGFNFQEKLVDKIVELLGNIAVEPSYHMQYSASSQYEHEYNSVVRFPYTIYYNIIATTSTNIYEIPFSGKTLYASQGGGFSKQTFGGLENQGSSLIGQAMNWFGKNIKVNINPTWDGPQDTPTKVDVEFTLYNDDIDGALKNFIFVNTIVPGNKWLQYNIFQHSPNLYDIKINGIDRLFMCQGDFSVEYAGQLRKPSRKLIDELCSKYANTNADNEATDGVNDLFGEQNVAYGVSNDKPTKAFLSAAQDNIRIPDQYNIKMTFTSLLPNNFNNFLYSYWYNDPIQKMGSNCTKPITQNSVVGEFLDKSSAAIKEMAEDFTDNFDKYVAIGEANDTTTTEGDEE